MSARKRHKWLWVGGVALLVLCAVVGGAFTLGARLHSKNPTAAEPAQTAQVVGNTSFEDVIPGTGATRTSTVVPAINIGYKATCIGAAQAVAGWTMEALGGLTVTNSPDVETYKKLVSTEILAASYAPEPGGESPVEKLYGNARELDEKPSSSPAPVNEVHAEYGAYRLMKCEAGVSATIQFYAPVSTNGWGPISFRTEQPREDVLAYEYRLVAQDGEWRVQSVDDLYSADRWRDGIIQKILTPYFKSFANNRNTFLTSHQQQLLTQALGTGAHAYKRMS